MDVIAVKRNGRLIVMSRTLQKPESCLQGSRCHKEIHNHVLLVSGLHCQYYSIMKNNSANIEENKGVLIQKVYLYNADVMMNGISSEKKICRSGDTPKERSTNNVAGVTAACIGSTRALSDFPTRSINPHERC